MYQVTFCEQAMHELNRLDKLAQLDAIDPITSLKPADLAHPREPLGHFRRGPKSLFRLRSGDFRFYFEQHGDLLDVIRESCGLVDFRSKTFSCATNCRSRNSSW